MQNCQSIAGHKGKPRFRAICGAGPANTQCGAFEKAINASI